MGIPLMPTLRHCEIRGKEGQSRPVCFPISRNNQDPVIPLRHSSLLQLLQAGPVLGALDRVAGAGPVHVPRQSCRPPFRTASLRSSPPGLWGGRQAVHRRVVRNWLYGRGRGHSINGDENWAGLSTARLGSLFNITKGNMADYFTNFSVVFKLAN